MSNSDSQNDKDKAEIEITIEPEIEKQPENEIEIELETKTETEVAESGEPVEEMQSDVDVSQDVAVEDAPPEVAVTQDEPVEESSDVSVLPIEDNEPSIDVNDTEAKADTENKTAEKFIEAFKSDKETFAQKLKKIHENLASISEPKKSVDDAGILKIAVTLAVITAVTVFMLAILNSITSPVIQERLINETSFGDDIVAVESDGELE